MKENIAEEVRRLKSKGCSICGYSKNYSALAFDHIDPTTKYRSKNGKTVNPSDMVEISKKYSDKTIMAELAKCIVLCTNCHMEKTYPNNAIR